MVLNIGGYGPNSMLEKHEFGLVIASSKSEAKNIENRNGLWAAKKKA